MALLPAQLRETPAGARLPRLLPRRKLSIYKSNTHLPFFFFCPWILGPAAWKWLRSRADARYTHDTSRSRRVLARILKSLCESVAASRFHGILRLRKRLFRDKHLLISSEVIGRGCCGDFFGGCCFFLKRKEYLLSCFEKKFLSKYFYSQRRFFIFKMSFGSIREFNKHFFRL